MLFRFLVTSLFFCQQISSALAIREYLAGDTLYVWAASGLSLRREADLNAEKLLSIPYGTPIIVQSDKFTNVTDDVRVEVAPGYIMNDSVSPAVHLNGRFAKVTYRGKTGYLFDGYLSKLPVMRYKTSKSMNGTIQWIFEDFDIYAKRVFGILREFRDSTSYSRIYKNGMTEICYYPGEEENDVWVTLPNLSWEEVFLIFNHWNYYEESVRKYPAISPSDYPWQHKRRLSADGPVLEFWDAHCSFVIQSLNAQRLVIFHWACTGC